MTSTQPQDTTAATLHTFWILFRFPKHTEPLASWWLLVVLAPAEVFDGLAVLQNGQGIQLADVVLLEPGPVLPTTST